MPNVNQNALANILKVFGGNCIPPEGPKAIPVLLPFTTTEMEFVANLALTQEQHSVSYIQAIYVDNQFNDAALDIFIPVSQHLVTIPAHYQGFVALLAPNPPSIEFGSVVIADTPVIVQLLNFPVSNCLWSTDPTFSQTPLNVTDPVLDALLAGGYLPVLSQALGSGLVKPIGMADTFAAALNKTTTASQNIIAAPGAGSQLWIEYINFSLLPASTMAVAGDSILTVLGGAAEIANMVSYVGAAAVTVPGIADYSQTIYPRCRIADNTALTATLNTALTAGSWRIRCGYSVLPTV